MGSSIHSNFVGISGGVLMSVIAFSIVFIVIAGLMLLMMGLKYFVSSVEKKEAARATAPSAPSAPPAAPVVAKMEEAGDSDELIAVISAAVAAACGSSARVVSFAPAPPRTLGTPWRMTGRLQNSEGFGD